MASYAEVAGGSTPRGTRNIQFELNNGPYFLGSNENTSASLVNPCLSGPNYHSWKRSMEIALGAKSKVGFVNGKLPCPLENDILFEPWQKCNLVVQSWILNSVSTEIAHSILYANTATDMWSILSKRFAQSSDPRIFEVQQELNQLKQGALSVTSYFTQLETLWNELAMLNPLPKCSCGGISNCSCGILELFWEREQKAYKMKFLMGLSDVFERVRSHILMMKPAPSINDAFNLVVQEEKQRSLKHGCNDLKF